MKIFLRIEGLVIRARTPLADSLGLGQLTLAIKFQSRRISQPGVCSPCTLQNPDASLCVLSAGEESLNKEEVLFSKPAHPLLGHTAVGYPAEHGVCTSRFLCKPGETRGLAPGVLRQRPAN